jgi:hypothetical protein
VPGFRVGEEHDGQAVVIRDHHGVAGALGGHDPDVGGKRLPCVRGIRSLAGFYPELHLVAWLRARPYLLVTWLRAQPDLQDVVLLENQVHADPGPTELVLIRLGNG